MAGRRNGGGCPFHICPPIVEPERPQDRGGERWSREPGRVSWLEGSMAGMRQSRCRLLVFLAAIMFE